MTDDAEREAQIRNEAQFATIPMRTDKVRFLLRLLDEARAEIVRLNEQVGYFMAEYQDEDGITELRAEIARLEGVVADIVRESAARLCALSEAQQIIARLQAPPGELTWTAEGLAKADAKAAVLIAHFNPPGASAMELSQRLYDEHIRLGCVVAPNFVEDIARAIAQAEAEARAKAIEEAAQIATDYGHVTHNTAICPEDSLSARIRALAKPSG